MTPHRSNRRFALGLFAIIALMGGVTFASVPLYRLFCAATGYGGTPQIGPAAPPGASARMITVRFNADTNPGLPWEFSPEQREIRLRLGEEKLAFYHARNLSGTPVTGTAVYNVTPEKAGIYFHKTACFCFNEQKLDPGQTQDFPLSFWVDPKLAEDRNTDDITTITLSYTFFRTLEDAAKAGALAKAGPHVGAYAGPRDGDANAPSAPVRQ